MIALPAMIVYGFGIPFLALVLLIRNRKYIVPPRLYNLLSKKDKVYEKRTNQKYGFLYLGYKSGTFYWEIVIIYRKVFVVMIAVFFETVSEEVQALLILLLLCVSLGLQFRFTPYLTRTLNYMETLSLCSALLTIYVGLYYLTGKQYTYMNNGGI